MSPAGALNRLEFHVSIASYFYSCLSAQARSVCVCVCVSNANLGNRLQSSTEIYNASRSRYFIRIKLNRFVIEGLVFELWCDLLTHTAIVGAQASS